MAKTSASPSETAPATSTLELGNPESTTSERDGAPAANDEASASSAPASSESAIESSTRQDLVRQAAYRRYKERGTSHGDEVQDWLEAEAEINQSLIE
jgi:hypothetical protein